MRRRRFLSRAVRLAAAGACFGGLPRALAAKPPVGPRYVVSLFLRGGIDAVYTTDPKTRADVDRDVDVPYPPSSIVDGAIPLGPHFAPLSRFTKDMAIVRGLQVHVANHEGGAYQFLRMRTGVMPNMASLGEIIGQRREQALASVTLGDLSSFDYSANSLVAPTGSGGRTALDMLDALDDESISVLAKSYRKHLRAMPESGASERQLRTREHLAQLAEFLERSSTLPRFQSENWGLLRDTAADLQRALYLCEHDLARCVTVKIQLDWDSHFRNAAKQEQANGVFAPLLARFIDELHRRRNAQGSLASQTLLVVGSELGRFPVINGNLGKDHFPETQLLLMGPGIRPGAYGQTAKRMQGRRIDVTSAAIDGPGGVHLELDDIGATILGLTGYTPSVYGYRGRRLGFLVAA